MPGTFEAIVGTVVYAIVSFTVVSIVFYLNEVSYRKVRNNGSHHRDSKPVRTGRDSRTRSAGCDVSNPDETV
jgi:hypothetical protein